MIVGLPVFAKVRTAHDFHQFRTLVIRYLRVAFMYRQFAAILLILLFAAYHFNRTIIVLDYVANQAAFAKNCENKARPAMHCNGKCQLMKKLKEEEKKEEQNPSRKSENKQDQVCVKPLLTTPVFSLPSATATLISISATSFPKGFSAAIFHPPALI